MFAFHSNVRSFHQVKMTRCLYAMLLHHKYQPDRRTGWHLPPQNSSNYMAHLIGVKLVNHKKKLIIICRLKASFELRRCFLHATVQNSKPKYTSAHQYTVGYLPHLWFH